ncbi:MAG: hypothetical protein ACI8VZ_001082, partial [Candidatus Paceibacteria bacterium]
MDWQTTAHLPMDHKSRVATDPITVETLPIVPYGVAI